MKSDAENERKRKGLIEDEINGLDLIPQTEEIQLMNICLTVANDDYYNSLKLFNTERFSDVLRAYAIKLARNYQPPNKD